MGALLCVVRCGRGGGAQVNVQHIVCRRLSQERRKTYGFRFRLGYWRSNRNFRISTMSIGWGFTMFTIQAWPRFDRGDVSGSDLQTKLFRWLIISHCGPQPMPRKAVDSQPSSSVSPVSSYSVRAASTNRRSSPRARHGWCPRSVGPIWATVLCSSSLHRGGVRDIEVAGGCCDEWVVIVSITSGPPLVVNDCRMY